MKTSSKSKQSLPDVVNEAFEDYPEEAKATLLKVRQLILAVKESDSEIGELEEALRWRELSYLTQKPNTGSMIRLALNKAGQPAVFFHCGTTLVENFRMQYAHVLEFEDNRAIVLPATIDDVADELSDCIKQTLRYKLDK